MNATNTRDPQSIPAAAHGGGGLGHKPKAVPILASPNNPFSVRHIFKPGCLCGWVGSLSYQKHAPALRAARRHVQEAQA